jgi:hypothetical protein
MGDETSELRIVPMKRGNLPEGPRGGKAEPGARIAGEKDAEDADPRQRLNETAANS